MSILQWLVGVLPYDWWESQVAPAPEVHIDDVLSDAALSQAISKDGIMLASCACALFFVGKFNMNFVYACLVGWASRVLCNMDGLEPGVLLIF
jgi:hypothetical protein